MKITAKNRMFLTCAMFVSTLTASSPASAASIFINDITGTGARNYFDTTIWPGDMLPLPADQPVIDKGDGINDYVYIDTNLSVARFNVGNQNTGGLELRTGAYVFLSQGSNQTNVGPGQPGFAGLGYLRIQSGATLENTGTGLMYVGANPLGVGTVTLEGTHFAGTRLIVASSGTGTYNMLAGSTLTTSSYLMMGEVSGSHGEFKQSGGTLTINRTHATAHGLYLGFNAGANGLYEISGGSLTVAATNQGVMNGTNAAAGGSTATFRVVGSAPDITIGNHYIQRSGAMLDLVIGATGISPLKIGGNATLDLGSILGASFTATPTVGQEFTIMNYTGTLTGTFSTFDSLVDSPLGPDTVQLAIDYGTSSNSLIKLTVSSLVTAHPGDFDGDGDVDGADFVASQTHFPKPTGATKAEGDADGDGDVDGADFVVWQTNFPFTPGPGASPVPEPHAALLTAVAGIALVAFGRKRSRTR